MTAYLSPPPKLQFFTAAGIPLVGGKLYSYAAGTTTPLATYTTYGAGTPNANPVVMDSRGEASVWLGSASYKLKLTDSTGAEIWTVDNITGNDNFTSIFTQLAASSGSSLIGFIQTGATTTRTVESKLRDVVSVKDFGAVGDGSTDDTTAIQNAINAMQGSGAQIYFPKGTYIVSSTLNVTGGLSFYGESRYGVSIKWTSTTLTVISVNTDGQVSFEKITFLGPVSATAGNIITLTGPTQNLFSFVNDCTFTQGYNQFVTSSAADWTITNCVFNQYVGYGVYVSDTYNIDAGDSFIGNNCTFVTSTTTATGILQTSSGGLKIANNKFLGGAYGYRMSYTNVGGSTVDLLITGNSLENQTVSAISFNRPSGTTIFGSVVIVGNQIAGQGTAVSYNWIGIGTDSNANWLSRFVVVGNLFLLPVGSGSVVFQGLSFGALSSFIISDNQFISSQNPSGSTYGISIGSSCSNGTIGLNRFDVFGSGTWTKKIDNGSSSAVFVTYPVTQTGAPSVTCSTGYGSLYTGTSAVTFSAAFDSVPVVTCSPNNVAGGVSAWPISVTTTGFTMVVVSVTNGGSGTTTWAASGVI